MLSEAFSLTSRTSDPFRWIPHNMATLTVDLRDHEVVRTSEVCTEKKETSTHSPNAATLETMKFLKETSPWWFTQPSDGIETTPTHLQTHRFRYLKNEQDPE